MFAMSELILRSSNPLAVVAPDDSCSISATNDFEAMMSWLNGYIKRPINTSRNYTREVKRYLIWLSCRGLTLSQVKVEDVYEYFNLLERPTTEWIIPDKKSDKIYQTQLIKYGGLSNRSINYTRTVLSRFYSYLQDAGYLTKNPINLVNKSNETTENEQYRHLDLPAWQTLWSWILAYENRVIAEDQPAKVIKKANRYRWVFALLYHSGIRCAEAANALMSDLVRKNNTWSLKVTGKGNKMRLVTVNSLLLKELIHYRRSLFLTDYPSSNDDTPLIVSIQKNRQGSMTTRTLSSLIKEVTELACAECEDDQITRQIETMTTHWLRHTNATHRFMAGASLETTQDELGHADPRTTRIYAKTSNEKRKIDAERLADLFSGIG